VFDGAGNADHAIVQYNRESALEQHSDEFGQGSHWLFAASANINAYRVVIAKRITRTAMQQ
jgi:hypothetical protein